MSKKSNPYIAANNKMLRVKAYAELLGFDVDIRTYKSGDLSDQIVLMKNGREDFFYFDDDSSFDILDLVDVFLKGYDRCKGLGGK